MDRVLMIAMVKWGVNHSHQLSIKSYTVLSFIAWSMMSKRRSINDKMNTTKKIIDRTNTSTVYTTGKILDSVRIYGQLMWQIHTWFYQWGCYKRLMEKAHRWMELNENFYCRCVVEIIEELFDELFLYKQESKNWFSCFGYCRHWWQIAMSRLD